MFKAVERAGIEVRYGTAVKGLKVGQPGGMVALMVEGEKGQDEIAAKGVVLGSGGFEANGAMRARHLGSKWENVKVRGTRHNTGEVLTLALEAGASERDSGTDVMPPPSTPSLLTWETCGSPTGPTGFPTRLGSWSTDGGVGSSTKERT